MLKMFETKYAASEKETPFRFLLKELFKYSEHVDIITFKNYSLAKLMEDSKDPRKHVSFETLLDFFKISGFKGVMNFDLDFAVGEDELLQLKSHITKMLEMMEQNGFNRMTHQDYRDFIKYMKENPTAAMSSFSVIL